VSRDDYPGDEWCPTLVECAFVAGCAALVVLFILSGEFK
jgi:hypothetical protein